MKLLKKILLYWIVIIPFSIVSISLTLIPVMTGGFISGSFSELLVGVIAFPFIVLIFFLPVMHFNGFIRSDKLISRLKVFISASIYSFITGLQYLYLWLDGGYEEDRNLMLCCFVFAIAYFYLKGKEKINSLFQQKNKREAKNLSPETEVESEMETEVESEMETEVESEAKPEVEAKIKSSNPQNVNAFKNIAYRIIAFLLLLGGLISSFSPIINNSANDNFLNSIVPLIADDDFFSAITGIFGFSLVALMFLLPATHLSNTIKNNILISRLNIFTILSIFYFLSASQYTYLWMVSDLEVDRNIMIYCFTIAIISFALRKKGKISSKDIASKIASLTDFKYEEFGDEELLKLLGRSTKIISKKNVCFPFNFHINLESKSDVEAQKMGFDVGSWNDAIARENKKIADNQRMRDHYENLIMQYENAKQLYSNAKMQRNQMIQNARKSKTLAYFANPIGSPPKRPEKPKYHTLSNPKEEDFYTKDEGIEIIKNLELKHNNDLNYFNFFDKGSFSRIFDISEWKVITKILKDIFISSEKNNLGHINSDFEPQDKDIKIKFNNSFLYSDSFDGKVSKDTSLLKAHIINFEKIHKRKKVENILKDKDLRLGNFKINSNKINYNIKDINYLPFLRVEVEEKNANKKIEIIDYIARTVVSLSEEK